MEVKFTGADQDQRCGAQIELLLHLAREGQIS